MSKLGKTPIALPKGVEIAMVQGRSIQIKGPKGALELRLPEGFRLKLEGRSALLEKEAEGNLARISRRGTGPSSTLHGLYWSLLRNAVVGVSEGYEVCLEMVGVGYRAALQGNQLDIRVGYSHPTLLDVPKGIKVLVDKGTVILVQGTDKREVGHFAARVRAVRPPEPYKGKGIRYRGEYVRKKEGKAAKAKTAGG